MEWGPTLYEFLYFVGVVQPFVLNMKWSFHFDGAATPSLIRYATVYAVIYVINFLLPMILVDQAGPPHQPALELVIFVVVSMPFVTQQQCVLPPMKE